MKRYPSQAQNANFRKINNKVSEGKPSKKLVWISFIATVCAAFIGSLGAAYVGKLQKDIADENRSVAYLEYANKLLTLPVSNKNGGRHIREFAVKIIDETAPFKLTDKMRKDFMEFQMPVAVVSGGLGKSDLISRLYVQPISHSKYDEGNSTKTSEQQELTHLRVVTMPEDIQKMWVFFQSKTNKTIRGCRRPRNANPLDPRQFASRLNEFIQEAKNDNDTDLIITAWSPTETWWSVRKIRIEGIDTSKQIHYFCDRENGPQLGTMLGI